MITLEIKINGKHIAIVEAVRDKGKKDINNYTISVPDYSSIDFETGKIMHWKIIGNISHKYSDGAIILTKKMLEILEANKDGNTV